MQLKLSLGSARVPGTAGRSIRDAATDAVGVAKRGPRWILLRFWRPCPAEKVPQCWRVQRRALRSVQSFGGSRPLCGPRRCRSSRRRWSSPQPRRARSDSFSAAAASPAPPCSSGLPPVRPPAWASPPPSVCPAAAVVRGLPGPVPGVCRDRLQRRAGSRRLRSAARAEGRTVTAMIGVIIVGAAAAAGGALRSWVT
jgi:hypothetical protein